MCIIQNFTLLYPAEIADSHKALHVKLEMMTPDRREESCAAGWFLSLTQTSEGRESAGNSRNSSALAGPTTMAYEVAEFAWDGSCNSESGDGVFSFHLPY